MKIAVKSIAKKITACRRCSRLRTYCQNIAKEKRKAYAGETYWGKPIPGFGSPTAEFVIIGLAPAAHGANRTGRIFTGDRSGEWLYRALFEAGFSNQPESHSITDGLKLKNTYITCAVHCAPPDNRPTPVETKNCESHFYEELKALSKARVYLVLGSFAFDRFWAWWKTKDDTLKTKPKFAHGKEQALNREQRLLMSYHPSQQNTFTGRLTKPMFDQIFKQARYFLQ